jgi:hypothetical protein
MTSRFSLLLIFLVLFHFSLCDVVSWGQGDNGRLGNGLNSILYSPLKLNSTGSLASQELKLKTIKKISCGNAHCLVLTGKKISFFKIQRMDFYSLMEVTNFNNLALQMEFLVDIQIKYSKLTTLFTRMSLQIS